MGSTIRSFRSSHLLFFAPLLLLARTAGGQEDTEPALARLGSALFSDQRFTNPAADYEASCSGCHTSGETVANRPSRFYADYVPRSLTATKERTRRNTPTLLDLGGWKRFGHDGASESLEELTLAKLTGPSMGWGPADRTRARDAIQFTLLEEGDSRTGESYLDLFDEAYDIDLGQVSGDQALEHAARALADFVRSIEMTQTAVWDAFRTQNRIDSGPGSEESPQIYGGRVEGRLGNLEGRLQIKLPEGFTSEAYEGFKTFFRTFGDGSVGNCIACHTPPHFTDFRFHNTGIAEIEYDLVHGSGAFRELDIPAAAERPNERFLTPPTAERPGLADLGYWNYAPEGVDLDAVVGAFKTPTLRNLGGTDPYMHNGAYATLDEAVGEIVRINQLARAGKLRSIDPEYLAMKLSEEDIGPLVAFLRQLDEVGRERFRYFLIHFED